MEIKIGNQLVGGNNPAFIVAELSCNHRQNFDIAVQTIKAMKEAGADAVKLSTDKPETLTLDCDNEFFQIKSGTLWDGTTLYKLYKETDTPWDWQPKLKKVAEDLGLICFSTPGDPAAADFLEKEMDVPAYKIASFEITDFGFIEHVAKKGKPIIIATGIALKEEIEQVIDICKKAGNDQIVLLKCTSSYPARPEEMNLRMIPDFKKKFKVEVGLSDHSMSPIVPVVAVSLGAKLVEKHFILDRKLGGPDGDFSLEPHEFKEMVKNIREAEKSLGIVNYNLPEKSQSSRNFARSLFITADMKAGEIFTKENVRSIRPGYGLHPKHLNDILGKAIARDAAKGTPLAWPLISK